MYVRRRSDRNGLRQRGFFGAAASIDVWAIADVPTERRLVSTVLTSLTIRAWSEVVAPPQAFASLLLCRPAFVSSLYLSRDLLCRAESEADLLKADV